MTPQQTKQQILEELTRDLTKVQNYPLSKSFVRKELELALDRYKQSLLDSLPEEKAVCGCDEDEDNIVNGFGYHTKDCDFTPYGYNQALKEVKEILGEQSLRSVTPDPKNITNPPTIDFKNEIKKGKGYGLH